MGKYHVPVMLYEALRLLNIKKDGTYVDCTLGGGGHSWAIAKRLSKGGRLISMDWDQDAIDHVSEVQKSKKYDCEWILVKSSYVNIKKVLEDLGIEKVDGILFDLGVSSHHFDAAERGFSFGQNAELDMRMDQDLQVKAKDLVNGMYTKELAKIFELYGEEPKSKKIAAAIVSARQTERIESTKQLADIIQKVVPFSARSKTLMRVFQALRIAVNDEIRNLQATLPQALEVLASEGRCVAISFHSLEDRVVKHVFKENEEKGLGKKYQKKPLLPSDDETNQNPRARSAKMRAFIKQ